MPEVLEGWYLTQGKSTDWSGVPTAMDHYFRGSRSLCGRRGVETISMSWLGPQTKKYGGCKLCRKQLSKENNNA